MKKSIGAAAMLSLLLVSNAALAQRADKPGGRMLCPRPTVETLGLKAAPTPDSADFPTPLPTGQLAAGVNETAINHTFRHTFKWNDHGCCQIMSATLTIVTKSLQAATTLQVSDARNDTYGITHNGVTAGGQSGYLYSGPAAAGTVKTTTIALNATSLANMNATGRLSFSVQDDSAVQKAVLRIERCCIDRKEPEGQKRCAGGPERLPAYARRRASGERDRTRRVEIAPGRKTRL